MERRDVIIVASVSCIYSLGAPEEFNEMCVRLDSGDSIDRDELLRRLIEIQYNRNDISPGKGEFRVRATWWMSLNRRGMILSGSASLMIPMKEWNAGTL